MFLKVSTRLQTPSSITRAATEVKRPIIQEWFDAVDRIRGLKASNVTSTNRSVNKLATVFKVAGPVLIVADAAVAGYSIYTSQDRPKETIVQGSQIATSWALAWAGGEAGFVLGSAAGPVVQ